MTDVFERTVPHNLEAERSILGAILLHEETLGDAAAFVGEQDFFRDAHRRIFKAMLALQSKRVAIDLTTLKEELSEADLEQIGGPAYITALVDGVPRSSNVEDYARIVSEKARLRAMIQAGSRMVAEAYEAQQESTEILERAEQAILGLADGKAQTGFESNQSISARALAKLEEIRGSKGSITGIPTGFIELDMLTSGLQPGTLVVLGARPGIGKSSFATNVANQSSALGHVAGMFSLEMPKEELFLRQVASIARIDSHRMKSGYLSDSDWRRVVAAVVTVTESPIHLDETSGIKMLTVRSRTRRLRAEHGLALLIIDYLQLMGTSEDRDDTRALALGRITRALKGLAKEMAIPILLLSQLNRDSAKGEKPRRPQLFDLKESGSIEEDADIVMFLHRSDRVDETDITELIVAKHRNGPIGTIKLRWNEQYTRFDNYASVDSQDERFLPMGDR